jgi:hypothetical protein
MEEISGVSVVPALGDFVERRRCGNCRYWEPVIIAETKQLLVGKGGCGEPNLKKIEERSRVGQIFTVTDFLLCSAWKEK